MTCCLTAWSLYLNQCWLIINEILWHSPEDNFTGNVQDIYPWYVCENYWFESTVASPRDHWVNTLRPRQNGRRFADDTFKRIFLNENVRISIKISLRFVPKGPVNNNSALVQIMTWRRSGDKPLSEPMMVTLLTNICVTRPQWVNSLWASDATWWHRSGSICSTLARVMACCLTAPSHNLESWTNVD